MNSRLVRLADFLNQKYQLTSTAADPTLMAEVRKNLRTLKEMWLEGPLVKDQSILHWADTGNKGPQFDLLRELIDIVRTLATHPSLGEIDTYRYVRRGLTISKILKDFALKEINEAMKTSMKGSMRHPDANTVDHRESKIRTFLRRVDGVFDSVRKLLSPQVPGDKKIQIDSESSGGYEEQKARALTKNEMLSFTNHPEAAKYGLDNKEFLGHLLNETQLRPWVEKLIRAVKRNHRPKAAPVVMGARDSFQELLNKLKTNVALFDSTEEGAQSMLGAGRPEEALTPAQQWSRQMQQSKQQKMLEQEEQPPVYSPEQLEGLVEKRDLEHEQRQEEKKKEEEALISKYNGLTFEQWMRKQ